jgi:hypothetical protein
VGTAAGADVTGGAGSFGNGTVGVISAAEGTGTDAVRTALEGAAVDLRNLREAAGNELRGALQRASEARRLSSQLR